MALRSNEGFQEDLYDALVGALQDGQREWRHAESIPKLAANVLAEIVPATQAVAYAYDEPVRQQVMEASFRLHDLIIECTAVQELNDDG